MQKIRSSFWGILTICALSVLFSGVSIFLLLEIKEQTSIVYGHPYAVGKEARELLARFTDTNFSYRSFLLADTAPQKNLALILQERFRRQRMVRDKIEERYTGPKEDVEKLSRMLDAFHKALLQGLPYASLPPAEIRLYLDTKVEPAYQELKESIDVLVRFTNRKILNIEKESSFTVNIAIMCSLLLVFVVLIVTSFFYRLQKRSEQIIAYREKLFDLLCTNVDDVFFIYHVRDKRVEYISGNADRILGLKGERDIAALYARLSDENQKVLDGFAGQAPFDAPMGCDFSMKNAVTGEERFMHLHLYPVKESEDAVRYVIAVSERTRAVKAQQTLRDALASAQQANAAKRDFLSRMSHEIRTPMNAIIGMSAIAATHIQHRERVADCLRKISFSSKYLMSLLNDVLDMSKIESGKLAIHHEEFDLPKLIDSIVSIIYPQTESQGQHFEVALSGIDEERLVGDSLRINQILLNLLSNARKFTPKGGSIKLAVSQKRQNGGVLMRFAVSDTGIGLSEEFQKRLFTPFEQADSSISQKYGGTGLGLAITQNLVTLMNGTIKVRSKEHEGASFAVELPLALPRDRRGPKEERIAQDIRVLVVDDDRDTCEYAALLLRRMGISAKWVLTALEALEQVADAHGRNEDYDVCFIDWKMPGMDGIEATRRIREMVGPETLIIIITAYDWAAIEQRAREAGANAFLSKPLFSSALHDALIAVSQKKLVPPGTAEESGAEGRALSLCGRHVLLAEDNELNREIAEEILKAWGVSVTCAENGQAAADTFMASAPGTYDAILMDIQMPVLDGYAAAAVIRASGSPEARTIPIIAMTANAFHEDVVMALSAGMNNHISKPIDPERMHQVLISSLRGQPEPSGA